MDIGMIAESLATLTTLSVEATQLTRDRELRALRAAVWAHTEAIDFMRRRLNEIEREYRNERAARGSMTSYLYDAVHRARSDLKRAETSAHQYRMEWEDEYPEEFDDVDW